LERLVLLEKQELPVVMEEGQLDLLEKLVLQEQLERLVYLVQLAQLAQVVELVLLEVEVITE
jgi:hypothetical protein